jgi:hypothetical protein
LTSSWLKSHKNGCRSMALLLCVIPQGLSRRSGERHTDFLNQLGGHCLQTYLGTLRIIRVFRDISDFLPVTDEGGIVLWGKTPCCLLPRFTFVFLHVCRTVSCAIESTISHATLVAASLRQVHLSWPSRA